MISLEEPLPPEPNHGSISTVSTYSLNLDSPMSTCISLDYNTPTITKNKKKNVRKAVKKKRSKGGMIVSPSSDKINPIINPKGIIRYGQKSYVKKHERKKDSYDSQLIETQVADTYYSPEKVLLNIHLALRDVDSATSPLFPDNLRKMECFHQPHWNAIKSMDLTQFIGKFPVYTFKKVHSMGTQLSFIYDDITQKIVRYSSGSSLHNPEAFELYLKLWFIFSPLFLRVSKGFSLSIIKHRIRQYQSHQWDQMLSELINDCQDSNKPVKPRHNKRYKGTIPLSERSLESRYESAAVSFEDKDISKAYQNIVSPIMTSNVVSSRSIEALRKLHPERKEDDFISEDYLHVGKEVIIPPLSTPRKLWKLIRNLKRGTAPGVDGLRSEHLVSMARHGKAKWITNMSEIVNLALAGALPQWVNDLFAYSKLIGLVKSNDNDENLKLRPIGIGMIWPKIISKTILNHYRPTFSEFFEPFQYGLSKSGLESITHITKEVLKDHPNWVLLRLDLVNAFNSVLRKIIFKEVHDHFPFLLPWLSCLYGNFSQLWTKSVDGTHYFPLSSQEGVKQGCTLGSFLFCLAIHNPIIRKINNLLLTSTTKDTASGFAFGLLDDINIIADPTFLNGQFWKEIVNSLADCGLIINMDKATLFTSTCSTDLINTLRSELPTDLVFNSEGVKLVGTPIGNDEFCKTFWDSTLLNEIRLAIPLVCSWFDVQRALSLFRLCIVSKYNYFLRHSDPRSPYAIEIASDIHHLIQRGLAYLLDPLTTEEFQSIINKKIWIQSILPPKMGGLGIQDPLLTHLPAFIAAAVVGSSSYLHLKKVIQVATF